MKYTKQDINRYLLKQMELSEREAFEATLVDDDALKQQLNEEMNHLELDFMDWLSTDIISQDVGTIYDELESEFETKAEKQTSEPQQISILHRMRPALRYAAAIAFLIISTTILYRYLSADTFSQMALSDQYYEEYKPDFSSAIKGGELGTSSQFNKMKALLDQPNEAEIKIAQNYFAAYPDTAENISDAKYYLAHSLYLLKDYKESSKTFKEFLELYPNHAQRYFADFYLVLALLANSETSAAIQQLETITASQNHPYQQIAVQLLQELKNNK